MALSENSKVGQSKQSLGLLGCEWIFFFFLLDLQRHLELGLDFPSPGTAHVQRIEQFISNCDH